jgi:hypothetical protein
MEEQIDFDDFAAIMPLNEWESMSKLNLNFEFASDEIPMEQILLAPVLKDNTLRYQCSQDEYKTITPQNARVHALVHLSKTSITGIDIAALHHYIAKLFNLELVCTIQDTTAVMNALITPPMYHCTICLAEFKANPIALEDSISALNSFEKHIMRHYDDNVYNMQQEIADTHALLTAMHPDMYCCYCNQYVISLKKHLETHKDQFNSLDPIICLVCRSSFKAETMISHALIHLMHKSMFISGGDVTKTQYIPKIAKNSSSSENKLFFATRFAKN